MPYNSCRAYPSSRAIGQHFCQGAGVFVSDHTRNRPTDGSVFGRKRGPALKKMPPVAARKGAFPACDIFDKFRVQQYVDASFSAEQSGFALLIIALQVAPEEHSRTNASHCTEPSIGNGHCM